jgi:hypothetical protein
MKIADIILKTYPLDYDWLPYLFRSLPRATGYRNIVVLLEEQYPEPTGLPANAVIARSRRYVGTDPNVSDKDLSGRGSVIERLCAFDYTDAEVLIFVDSDCVFARDIDFQTDLSICIDRPAVWWRTWEEAGHEACWIPAAKETLRYQPKVNTMCEYPHVYPASVMRAFWEFIGGRERFMTLHDFTDWNALGNYALDYHTEAVTPVHAINPGPHNTGARVHQFWSWHRANHPTVLARMRELGLAEGVL